MRKTTTVLIASGLLASSINMAVAQDDGLDPANMVELYACTYNEGAGLDELMEVIEDWNDWADDQDIENYSAWVMVPFYTSPVQEFDVAWLGGSNNAAGLGRVQDMWLNSGGDVIEQFNEVISCPTHAGFSSLNFKESPDREDPDNVVVGFRDCNIAEDSSFTELTPLLTQWSNYYEENGSNAGFWSFHPSMGGGGETFDFKWIVSHQNLEERGGDFDFWAAEGWQKGNELFAGKVSCDSARVYSLMNIRRAEPADD